MEKQLDKLSEAEYRALPIESFSSIKYILESPKIFQYYKEKPFKGSAATLMGTCVHHFIQGNRHLVAFNELSKTKKNAEAIAEFEQSFRAIAGDEGIIVPKSFEPKLNQIMTNFNSNAQAVKLIDKCVFEKAYIFQINGVDFKGRIDGVGDDFVLEIKSSSQATTATEFKESAIDSDYDMQAYMYLQATGLKKHYFIVANTIEPFKVAVYKSSPEFIESGRKKAMEATERYKKYILGKAEWNEEEEIEEI